LEYRDKKVIAKRLGRLERELHALERFSSIPLERYLGDEDLQAIVERRLQVLTQIAIDIANYLII